MVAAAARSRRQRLRWDEHHGSPDRGRPHRATYQAGIARHSVTYRRTTTLGGLAHAENVDEPRMLSKPPKFVPVVLTSCAKATVKPESTRALRAWPLRFTRTTTVPERIGERNFDLLFSRRRPARLGTRDMSRRR